MPSNAFILPFITPETLDWNQLGGFYGEIEKTCPFALRVGQQWTSYTLAGQLPNTTVVITNQVKPKLDYKRLVGCCERRGCWCRKNIKLSSCIKFWSWLLFFHRLNKQISTLNIWGGTPDTPSLIWSGTMLFLSCLTYLARLKRDQWQVQGLWVAHTRMLISKMLEPYIWYYGDPDHLDQPFGTWLTCLASQACLGICSFCRVLLRLPCLQL